jgi:hypothetical protein
MVQGLNPSGGKDISHLSGLALGPTQGVERLGRGVYRPPPSSAEVKERPLVPPVGLHGLLQGELFLI